MDFHYSSTYSNSLICSISFYHRVTVTTFIYSIVVKVHKVISTIAQTSILIHHYAFTISYLRVSRTTLRYQADYLTCLTSPYFRGNRLEIWGYMESQSSILTPTGNAISPVKPNVSLSAASWVERKNNWL